jgi:aspartyl-tRNA(Asn)/glutamyl-tRNA(Gln) amidotransferase subunit A
MELLDHSIAELSKKIHSREVSILELTQSAMKRLQEVEPKVDAYLDVYSNEAEEQAKELDKNLENATSPLYGIPASLKDVLMLKGKRTTAASKVLENYIAPYTATSVAKLQKVGAIFTGKVNTDEFTMGASTETSAYKITRNPWDLERVPGGSSGGSAVSVATGSAVYSLGTDTGGSIRQPASFNNVVGLKPTYGRVSRYGEIPMASGLDQTGPITHTVEDAALVLDAITGHDPKDATSLRDPKKSFSSVIGEDVKGMRIGIAKEYFGEGLDPEIDASVQKGIHELENLGAEVVEIALPHQKYTLPIYYIVAPAEISSNMSRYDGIRYGMRSDEADDLLQTYMKTRKQFLGTEVKRRILIGSYVLSAGYYDAYYKKAQQVRRIVIDEFAEAFKNVDAIISPVSPIPPFKIHERQNDPLSMYLADVYTVAINLAGLPAISVPAGFTKSGLPIGMQLIGRQLDEYSILRLGHAYQQKTDWHKKKPLIVIPS